MELEQRVAVLEEIFSKLQDYYTSAYSGEEIDARLASAGVPIGITKEYQSVQDMNQDFTGTDVQRGQFVLILTTDTSSEDYGKVYLKGTANWVYAFTLTDLTAIKGPQGPAGKQGPAGPEGKQGKDGAIGPKGDTGPANTLKIGTVTSGSEAGATITGAAPNQTLNLVLPKGDKGDIGPTGPQGPQGVQGEQGPQGATGPQGETGPVGPQGEQGVQGETGATGATGPQGPAGPANVLTIGSVTSGEVASATITGEAPNQTLNLVLEKGDKGDTGSNFTILGFFDTLVALQAAVPNPEAGAAYGVGTAAPYDIYIWDAVHSKWVPNGTLQGPQGPAGPQGPQGPQGVQGPQGPTGPAGADGKSAYQSAKDGGFAGTEANFNAALAQVPSHISDTTKHITASERAAWNGKPSMVVTEIPKGRMRGDIRGVGKVGTGNDLTESPYFGTVVDTANPDSWVCDINGDGKIDGVDAQAIREGSLYSIPLMADYYNNWTYHKVDDTSGYWTTELSIPAITAETEGSITWNGTGFTGTFIKSEAFSGGVRIYANRPPIEALPCAVSYHAGTGGQFVIANTGVSETYVQDALSLIGARYVIVRLTASGWSAEKKQTISVPGLTASVTKQLIIPTQGGERPEQYYSAGIRISARYDEELTFSCETIPTADMPVTLVIIPIIGKFK